MDKASGQGERPSSAEQGAATRTAIMDATAALIAELGWGQVTTRAIATRAGVPHGAVSYHFKGKEELLREAAVSATLQALAQPIALTRQAGSVRELVDGTLAWFSSGALDDPSVALLLETARQASRDPALREPIAAELRSYRAVLTGLVRADQERGEIDSRVSASGTATLVAALFDGVLLHLLVDPDLDVQNAAGVVHALLGGVG
ncbi:TetR/AcrR family transcriptional regulator [Actinomadura fulvescens]|uniref:HTH tetR-type domain-containing protein n=1 Tax=Actinomadura fulvescens TaxID=46160 RepID=A0ABP6D3S3_9ACTN